ncbi:MAG: alpha/beta hydrolase [Actinotalea sp.]|nr:alpha/beta hydrolase [Actinotalea sp.]
MADDDGAWVPDVLGAGFEARTLPLADDDEGEVVATLVRYRPDTPEPVRPARAVLYLHGWNDYFFQVGLAQFWHGQGAAFFALDLRKYGRSLREHQTPNHVEDLTAYDEEIGRALDLIHADLGRNARVLLMGHSTGGLVAALWADRNPGRLGGLVLNSPWLEMTGSSVARLISQPVVQQIARLHPRTPMVARDPGFYVRTLLTEHGGEWEFDERWRPTPFFPIRAGWLQAVMEGHARVAAGLAIDTPVLMAASARSIIGTRWREEMRAADVVLDADLLARRAVLLGPLVTVLRVDGGLHDLTLSPPAVREHFYAEVTRWLSAYGWAGPVVPVDGGADPLA